MIKIGQLQIPISLWKITIKGKNSSCIGVLLTLKIRSCTCAFLCQYLHENGACLLENSLFLLAYFFILQGYPSFCFRKLGIGSEQLRARNYAIKASGNTNGDLVPIAPVQLQSPVGHFLAEMLHNHPHLLPAALDKQLENLQSERDAQTEKPPPSSQDLLLYK